MNEKFKEYPKTNNIDEIKNIHVNTIVSRDMPKTIEEEEEVKRTIEYAMNNLRKSLGEIDNVKNR